MNRPKVSILTITYNQENFIREALEGFIMQETNFDFEIVVADDASTDGTPQVIQEFADKYPRLIRPILREKNLGAVPNSIATLREAKGEYIALCEGDDYWTDPRKLQLQVDFLDSHPDYAVCFHLTRVFYEDSSNRESIWPSINSKFKLTPEELIRENFIPTHAVMFRRQNYDHLPADVMPFDLYLHLYHASFGKIGFIDKVMSVYRRHDGGIWSSSFRDTDKLWQTYGLAHVALFVEVLELYQKPAVKEAIYNSLSAILSTLMEIDNKYQTDLLQQALNRYPEALGAFMSSAYKEKEQSQDKDKHIEELNKEIISLREQLFELKGQLYQIRRTPVIGDLIRIKAFLGRGRRKLRRLRGRAEHYYYSTTALIPRPVRRTVKHIIKFNFRAVFASTRVVSGKAWPAGQPLVSVVIPFYNRADTIDETLSSLALQTFTNFETIIVDDGSDEQEGIQKLAAIERTNPKLRILRQPNQGVATARNTGVKNARGKYVICLDSDDLLEPTYIEKCTLMLEATPDIGLVSTHQDMFGVTNNVFKKSAYDPISLYSTDNMVNVAAEFRRDAWRASGGYKSGIGYEDWEFWVNLAENGYWGKLLPEPLFKYRTSMQSRFVDDKGEMHWKNIQAIRELHPKYKARIKRLMAKRQYTKLAVDPKSAFVNFAHSEDYSLGANGKPKVLITIPWMTFGGAETLLYNYCREIKDQYDISFITGLKSDHEWEYKFRELSGQIYHLANMFDDERLHLEFVSNYILTRGIDVLHIVHNGFTYSMLPELKKRYPHLKVVVTLFNDRVPYFEQAVEHEKYIDAVSTDNALVGKHFEKEMPKGKSISVIPNGINCYEVFNPGMFDRQEERKALGLGKNELCAIFVGRYSEEKNPDVFVQVARNVIKHYKHIKFVMIGSGPMDGKIKKMLKETDSDQLISVGYQAKPAHFFSAADIFILPSSIEGFPTTLLEAMAMGAASIASRVGAVPDVIENGENGFIVAPGSVAEITDAVNHLAGDARLLSKIKAAGRKTVEAKYSTIVLGENYSRLYAHALHSSEKNAGRAKQLKSA